MKINEVILNKVLDAGIHKICRSYNYASRSKYDILVKSAIFGTIKIRIREILWQIRHKFEV